MITLATRTRKARRPGTCPLCGGPIQIGQRIAKLGYWVHAQCVAARVAEQDPGALVWGERTRAVRETGGESEVTTTYAAGVNIWLSLYQAERRHLVEVSRVATVTDAARRVVGLAEAYAEHMAAIYDRALAVLPPAQRELAAAALADELRFAGGNGA